MRKYNTFYYLLFVLIITGAFASMALNAYGMKLIAFSCLGFSLVFILEIVFGLRNREDLLPWNRRALTVELTLLAILSLLFFFRSLLIAFPYAEWVFILTILALIVNYFYVARHNVKTVMQANSMLGTGLIFYFISLILFSITFMVGILYPEQGTLMAIIGFVFLALFLGIGLMDRRVIIDGEEYSLFKYTMNMKNKTTLVFVAVIMIFSFYTFRDANLIPAMYSGETPTGYLRLIQEAETGQDNQQEKVDRFVIFKERYDQFVEKYGN